MRYNALYTAHQSCARVVAEGRMSGKSPSAEVLANEAKTLDALTKARGSLLDAMRTTKDS